MLKNILIIITASILVFFSGCGGESEEGESEEVQVKSKEEFKEEAQEQIDEENMEEELTKIEQSLEEELSAQ